MSGLGSNPLKNTWAVFLFVIFFVNICMKIDKSVGSNPMNKMTQHCPCFILNTILIK